MEPIPQLTESSSSAWHTITFCYMFRSNMTLSIHFILNETHKFYRLIEVTMFGDCFMALLQHHHQLHIPWFCLMLMHCIAYACIAYVEPYKPFRMDLSDRSNEWFTVFSSLYSIKLIMMAIICIWWWIFFSKEVINLHSVQEYTLLMQLHVDVEYPTAFNVTLDCDCDLAMIV